MPKCENCYHYEACNYFLKKENKYLVSREGFVCEHFKDKSLIVELPCKVGDVLYQIDGGEIYPIKISDVVISDCDTEFNGCEIDDEGNEFDEYSIRLSEFGKTVFTACEEAGKALEEWKNE